jgi:chromosome partitioning protein
VLNEKGGTGKTTTVTELTYQFGKLGLKTLVIDLDPQQNATIQLSGKINHKLTIHDVLVENIEAKKCLIKAYNHWPNTLVIPSSAKLAQISRDLDTVIDRDRVLLRAIQPFKNSFDVIVFDLAPTVNILTVNALIASNMYLIPTDISAYSVSAIERINKLANDIRIKVNNNLEFCGVLLTGYEKQNSFAVKEMLSFLEEEYNEKLFPTKIPRSIKVCEAQKKNVPIAAIDSTNGVVESYRIIANQLFKV